MIGDCISLIKLATVKRGISLSNIDYQDLLFKKGNEYIKVNSAGLCAAA